MPEKIWYVIFFHIVEFILNLDKSYLCVDFCLAELRKATLPIFFDMMACEFNQPGPVKGTVKGNFKEVGNWI